MCKHKLEHQLRTARYLNTIKTLTLAAALGTAFLVASNVSAMSIMEVIGHVL